MKIDIFCHIFPESAFKRCFEAAPNLKDMGKRVRNVPMLFDLDLRFRVMDRFGDYRQVISMASPPLEAFAGPEVTPGLARVANDAMAELVSRHPDRFPGFLACLPMNNPAEAEVELHRSVRDLGARGVQIFSNVNGLPLDRDEFRFVFEVMSGYDLPIWLHPARGANFPDYLTEDRSLYEIWWTLGLAVRDQRRHGSPGVCRRLRAMARDQDHHPPHGSDGAVLRGPDRARMGSTGDADERRRL
jgi:aminocarboxymuconate-semialdehyde decarboxylase